MMKLDKTTYLAKRKALMDEVNALLDEGDIDASEAKMKDVTALDEEWDKVKTAMANAKALEGAGPMLDLTEPMNAPVPGKKADDSAVKPRMTPEEALASKEYTNAWAKYMLDKALTPEDEKTIQMVNEDFVHSTGNTSVLIPDTVAQGIWEEVEDMYPYYNDITKTSVKGNLTIIKANESPDASWYVEDDPTESVEESFTTLQLTGCELSRAVTVTYMLKEMAIADFIPYITRRMAERMGIALGYGVISGAGHSANPPEPEGVITALEAEDGTPQIVKYSGNITYQNLTETRSKIKSGYATGLAVYASASTIWNQLANIVDNNNRPILLNDVSAEGGVTRLLGCVVKEDASIPDGDVLFSNASRGYQANINKNITMETENHAKARTTDYVSHAIVDGAVLTNLAHALLQGE